MKTIIIKSHPSSEGFTHKISSFYEKYCTNLGRECSIIDVYEEKYKLDFLAFEDVRKDFPITAKVLKIQEEISKADELVFVFPMWNLSEPAILKNFFDRVFTAKFAFKYVKGSLFPVGLLTGKKVKIFVTCDGFKIIYLLLGNPLKKIWKYGRIILCGMKLKKFIYIDRMRKKNDEKLQNILKKIETQGNC